MQVTGINAASQYTKMHTASDRQKVTYFGFAQLFIKIPTPGARDATTAAKNCRPISIQQCELICSLGSKSRREVRGGMLHNTRTETHVGSVCECAVLRCWGWWRVRGQRSTSQ
jgi:hypothetical protein